MKFKLYHYFLLSAVVILIDQAVKMAVYFNMDYGGYGEIHIFGDWFKLHYTTNPGMAFGYKFSGDYGKILLTLFRLGAMVAIGFYVSKLYKKQAHKGLIICISLILGGAVGNLVDSIFYAVFDDNLLAIPESGIRPSTPWFHGMVIDMFYFDLGDVDLPEFLGGRVHLWPIFNIADAAIFVSVIVIVIKQTTFFPKKTDEDIEQPQKENEVSKNAISE